MDGPVDGEGTGEKVALTSAEVDGMLAALVSVTIPVAAGWVKEVTDISAGAEVKEGNADGDGVVEGVRTVVTEEAGTLEAPDSELLKDVAFCAAAYPKKTSASEGMLARRMTPCRGIQEREKRNLCQVTTARPYMPRLYSSGNKLP